MIEGGHDSDPDPQHGGRVRVRDISRHGPLVKREDLPFCQLLSGSTASGPFEFNRPPLPGQLVVFWVPPGAENTGYAHPIGIPHGIDSGGQGIPGNTTIDNIGKTFESLINLPPDALGILQQNRTGLQKLTKQIQNASQQVKLELLDGIPNHGATALLSGIRNIPLKNITTAIDSFDQVLNSNMNLGGQPFSLGSLFDQMPADLLNNLLKGMPSELATGLGNLMSNMAKETGVLAPPVGATAGSQINPNTFFQTVLTDLQKVSTFGELSDALSLLSDPSKTGMDQLPNITQTITTAFGPMKQQVDALGNITNQLTDILNNLIQLFESLVSGIPGLKSVPLLSPNGIQFTDLINRLSQNAASQMNSELQQFSPQVNQILGQMESKIKDADNGAVTVAGILFGPAIQHITTK